MFPCGRWLAKDEEDGAIVRDLVCEKVIDERFKNGELETNEREMRDRLESKYFTHGHTLNIYKTKCIF